MDHCITLMLALLIKSLLLLKSIPMAARRPDSSNNHKYWCLLSFKARRQVPRWPLGCMMLNAVIYPISMTMSGRDRQRPLLLVFLRCPHNNSRVGNVTALLIQATGMATGTLPSRSREMSRCIQRNNQTIRWTTLLQRITCTPQVLLMILRLDLLPRPVQLRLTTPNVSPIIRQYQLALPLTRSQRMYASLSLPRLSQMLALPESESNFTPHPYIARHFPTHLPMPMGIRIRTIPDTGAMQAGWGCATVSDADLDCNSYLSPSHVCAPCLPPLFFLTRYESRFNSLC